MKNKIIRTISMLLLLCTFFIIFGFSSQDGEASGNVSRKVAKKIVDIFPSTRGCSEEAKQNIVEDIQPIVRKLAHFSIYMVVGILMMTFMTTFSLNLIRKIFISVMVGIIYASSDEIHQSFIPDRTPAITDVIIDTAGVMIGIFIVLFIIKIIIKKEKRGNNL